MTDRETTRLIAWSNELRHVHARLREALDFARAAVAAGAGDSTRVDPGAAANLLLYCRGFCVALDKHHRGEDRALFPAIEAAHPELADPLRMLRRDHLMIDELLTALSGALDDDADAAALARHLDGIGAIMENHFAYEERQLLAILDTLALDEDAGSVLGPL